MPSSILGATVIYGSLCSGMEAATCAWHKLGWQPAFFSEIDKQPSRLLAAKHPHIPNLGDMTQFKDWPHYAIDLLVGGTPCQSFSIAGLRKGLDDPRGNLMLTYLAIAARYRPRWLVWENVPGVLSSNGGRDFGTFLAGLGQCGYGFAYRVLDAQYVRVESHRRAVPQRRRRVFVVGYLGDWRRAAAVLFEREGLQGHSPPRRKTGQGAARGFETGPNGGRWTNVAPTMDARANDGPIRNQLGVGVIAIQAAATRENPLSGPGGIGVRTDGAAYTLEAQSEVQAVAFDTTQITSSSNYSNPKADDHCHPLAAGAHPPAIATQWAVRRLSQLECTRLQGFPDDYWDCGAEFTDGAKYKMLGNSMAVNVMRWIGERIAAVDAI